LAFGESIGINGGQGWDGMGYTDWARHFYQEVIASGLTHYHSQRVLPSAIVHYALRVAGRPTEVRDVILGFKLLNTALLASAAVLWAHLAASMLWCRSAAWAGFVALFACFANARHALFYPTLTDPMAFALGMMLLWGYLTDRPVATWLSGIAGTLTWPPLPALAMAMLVLPRPATPISPVEDRWTSWLRLTALASALLGVARFLQLARRYYLTPVPGVGDDKFAQWVRSDLLVLTVPLLAVALGAGWYVLLAQRRLWNVRAYVRGLALRRTLLAVGAVAAWWLARAWWFRHIATHGEGPTTNQFECELTLSALRGPLWGPVHHVVYYGPIITIACLYWRRIGEIVAGWGPAFVLAFAMLVVFAAGSNSRQWNHLFPFVVAGAIAATNERWTTWRVWAFAGVALLWSKVWLKIGYETHINWREFPNQRYFMNHGPYASDTMYLLHLGAAACTMVGGGVLLRRRLKQPSA
jgi:hypothetical protein